MWVVYLEKQVRGGLDPLLEQNAQRPVLLLEVENPSTQLQTLLFQVLQVRRNTGRWSRAPLI